MSTRHVCADASASMASTQLILTLESKPALLTSAFKDSTFVDVQCAFVTGKYAIVIPRSPAVLSAACLPDVPVKSIEAASGAGGRLG